MPDARSAPSEDSWAPEQDMGAPEGLAWSWELDFDALQAALDGPAPWNRPRPTADRDSTTDNDAAGSDAIDSAAVGRDGDAGRDGGRRDDATAADSAEEDQEALLDAMLASERSREVPISVVAGRIAESLPTGPGLAAWLASACRWTAESPSQ